MKMTLRQVLNEIDSGKIVSEIERHFKECITKHFSQFKKYVGSEWPIPKFVLRQGTTNAGEFSYIPTNSTPQNQKLTINPDFAVEPFLKQIVFHETIHYVQANLRGSRISPYDIGPYKLAHDQYFMSKMADINSIEGSNFITVKQDARQLETAHKEFHVYGIETKSGQFATIWSPKAQPQLEKWLKDNASRYNNTFYFVTTDYYFKTKNTQFKGASLKWGVVEDPAKIEKMRPNKL